LSERRLGALAYQAGRALKRHFFPANDHEKRAAISEQ
jgi:hypothetical protein